MKNILKFGFMKGIHLTIINPKCFIEKKLDGVDYSKTAFSQNKKHARIVCVVNKILFCLLNN